MNYKSFARYKVITIGDKTFKIKRLTIGETIEFQAAYNYWLVYGKGVDDLVRLSGISESVSDEEAAAIVTAEKDYCFNTPNEKKDNVIIRKKKDKSDWLISMIARFAYFFGWTRDEVLALYFDEANALLEEINEIHMANILEAVNVNNPTKAFLDGLKRANRKSEMSIEQSESDRDKIEAIKAAQRRR